MQKYFVPYFLRMVALSSIFERLVLLEAEARCPPSKRGRPRELSDSEALSVFFKVLRTGMQWREADGDVHYTTLLRRMHVWSKNHVFDAAYTRALKTYKRLCPTTHYCVDSSYVKNAFRRTLIPAAECASSPAAECASSFPPFPEQSWTPSLQQARLCGRAMHQ